MLNPAIDPNTGLPVGMNMQPPVSSSFDPIQWVKDNPIAAGALGVGAYFLFSPSKNVSAVAPKNNKKTLGILLIGGAAAYMFLHKSTAPAVDTSGDGSGAGTGTDTGTGSGTDTGTGSGAYTDTAATSTARPTQLEKDTFNVLLSTLQADPWFAKQSNRIFPADFFDAVQTDYARQLDGYPRTPDYAAGLPGSFMSVSDAWFVPLIPYPALFPNWTGITPQTHDQLWSIYSAYRQKAALQNF